MSKHWSPVIREITRLLPETEPLEVGQKWEMTEMVDPDDNDYGEIVGIDDTRVRIKSRRTGEIILVDADEAKSFRVENWDRGYWKLPADAPA